MYSELAGKVVIVTGAGRPKGIGCATATRFAAEGASVVVVDLPTSSSQVGNVIGISPKVDHVYQAIKASGGDCMAYQADVSDPQQVEQLIDTVVSKYSRVDVMVCNAAITHDHGLDIKTLTETVFSQVLAVNLTGTFLCAQAAARHMIENANKGTIVTIGSRASRRGNPNIIAYSASKFGVLGMSQSLALALAPHGIRVNCVCPGSVDTDMADAEIEIAHKKTGINEDKLKQMAIDSVPLGRLTSPEDLANTIVWLASSQSNHLTGQAINVNGGSWLS